MRVSLLVLAALLQTGTTPVDSHRFTTVRAVTVQTQAGDVPRACAALDEQVYEHAAAGLADVRLLRGGGELPYALTMSDTPAASLTAKVLNLGRRGHDIAFDLEMPHRLYSRVDLDLDQHDFIEIAKVTGMSRPGEGGTLLGTFDLFDFLADGLARNTSLLLAESNFAYLHVEITPLGKGHEARDINQFVVRGAVVPPSRQAQTVYTVVEESGSIEQEKRDSMVTFRVPARVPVERVSFELGDGGPRNFNRMVRIRARAYGDAGAAQEDVGASISRTNMTEQGEKLREESLSVPATVGSNAQGLAIVEVIVENGDDQPVGIKNVKLEMRERKICFDASTGAEPVQMFYGDQKLVAPEYDFGRLYDPTSPALTALLGAEQANPAYTPPADTRSFAEKHPRVLWAALIGVILILGLVALGSARRV